MIASSAFFVLEAILDWPVSLYDGSWSQWGQLSGSSANGGTLRSDSIWRTDTAARSGLIVYNFDSTVGPVFYTVSSGTFPIVSHPSLSTSGSTFTGTANRSFRVEIDSSGTPDTFRWTLDSTVTSPSWTANVAITGGAQTLAEGMVITFATTTGHNPGDPNPIPPVPGDLWDFITKRPVELLSSDGGSCSSRLNLNNTNTFDPVGCMQTPPESQAASANQIEEADAAYMAGGGGGNGGGGGGPIAPGY